MGELGPVTGGGGGGWGLPSLAVMLATGQFKPLGQVGVRGFVW
jgi:hypothetical protein